MATTAKKTLPPGAISPFQRRLEQTLMSARERQSFLEDLSTLIDDGVPANKAVEVLHTLNTGNVEHLAFDMLQKLSQGRGIADGMVGWFPQHIIELVRTGESGGTLAQNIRVAAESLTTRNQTVSSLVSSLSYPVVVICMGMGVMVYVKSSILNSFASIKPVSQWPEIGQTLMSTAGFIQDWWWMALIILALIAIGLTLMLKNVVGEPRALIDKIPVLNIYRQLVAARFMETLGVLISNGVVFKQALKILQNQASPYLAWHLMMIERRLGRGRSNIAEVLETGLVSEADVIRLKAIADAKGFEHALVRLGKQAADRGIATVRKFGKVLGGILLLVGGGIALLMVFGIYSVGFTLA